MKKMVVVVFATLVAGLLQATPIPSGQLELRLTVRPYVDTGQAPNTTYNPRFFDDEIYATQLNYISRCIGRYGAGSAAFLGGTIPPANEHRMLGRLQGPGGALFMVGSGGADVNDQSVFVPTLTRYDADQFASNPQAATTVDNQVIEGFDWVDDNTMISTCYTSGNRKRLYLTDVTAEPFGLSRNTSWNANGYVETPVTTRIRNVRKGDLYSGYAYFGDAGQNNNPGFYAIELATGAVSLLGSAGALTGSGSFGLWTVVERAGYLYVQTTDNGILVYSMNGATTLGPLYTTYTRAELDAATGNTTAQYFGLDVSADSRKLLLGGLTGRVYELGAKGDPLLPAQLQLSMIIELAKDLDLPPASTFNPRFFDGFDYVSQVNAGSMGFGVYPSGSPIPTLLVTNAAIPLEHRMVAPFRGVLRSTYILGSSMGAPPGTTTFSRYNFDGSNRVDANTPDNQAAEGFDWVDDNTIIYTVYNPSANRKRLYLVDVVAEPFSLAINPAWNPAGYITTSVSTRIRNVRTGDKYSGYAYYGDGNQNANPNFYAVNLANGAETLLGNAGTLTGSGSFGIWSVLERGGYLYVQTTDNGIQVYNMTGPTTLGALYATYDKATLDTIASYTGEQYYGLDVTSDGPRMLLGASQGLVFEFGPPTLTITRSGTDVVLSWPKAVTAVAVQGATSIAPTAFTDLDPQPSVTQDEKFNAAQVPAAEPEQYFRLRRTP